MTTDERIDRIEAALEKLTGVLTTVAGATANHDARIEATIRAAEAQQAVSERHDREIEVGCPGHALPPRRR